MMEVLIIVVFSVACFAFFKWIEKVNFKKGYEWAVTSDAVALLDFPIDRSQEAFEILYFDLSVKRGSAFANGAIQRWTEIMSYTPKAA